jgi:hypothetical protein
MAYLVARVRPGGVAAAVAAVALAASTTVALASADPAKAAPHAAHWMPYSASAPCKGAAAIAVRVSHNPQVHEPDRLRVTVRNARPNSRWHVEIAVYSGDSGSVGSFPTQHADAQGRWTLSDYAAGGHTKVDVTSTSTNGQQCDLVVSGQITRY